MRPKALFTASLLIVLAACGGGGQSPGTAATTPPAEPSMSAPGQTDAPVGEATPGTSLTACELVTPGDIEAALELDAGTVAEGALAQKPTSLDPAVNECRYQDESWGGLVVLVTPTDGLNVYDALVKAFGDDAEALDIGDGALWFENNDRGYFLEGSVVVLLQFTFITSPMDSFRDPTIAVGQAAVARI